MDLSDTLDRLRRLEPLEQAGKEYFARTGQIPDYFQVCALQGPGETAESRERLEDLRRRYTGKELTEELFMPPDVNVELEHLLRYVDVIAHRHGFFEMVCVLEGRCLHSIERQPETLEAGDIAIVPPGLLHHLTAEPDCVCLTIKVRSSTFDRAFSALLQEESLLSVYFASNLYAPPSRSALTFHCGQDDFIAQQLLYMYRQQQEKLAYCDNIIEGILTVLFSYLLQNHQDSIAFSSRTRQIDQQLGQVLVYLSTHYCTATLTNTAQVFFLNPSYLSASLHKATGYTFSQLVRGYRLRRAAQLLAQSRMKLDEICEQIGYQDTTQFIRYFKEAYGCTPHVYRRQARQPSEPAPL